MPKKESNYPLVDAAANYVWSKNGQEAFKDFTAKHAPLFLDAPILESGAEQDLEYYSLFQQYLSLYEDQLSGFIETTGANEREFADQLEQVQTDPNTKGNKKLTKFVDYLIASTDYPMFYKAMIRAAKVINNEEGSICAANFDKLNIVADNKGGSEFGSQKAEAKGTPKKGGGGAKCTDDDEEEEEAKFSHK